MFQYYNIRILSYSNNENIWIKEALLRCEEKYYKQDAYSNNNLFMDTNPLFFVITQADLPK